MAKTAMTSRFEDFCVFVCKNNVGKIKNIQKEITDLVYKIGFMNFAKIMYGEGRYKDVASACKNLNKKINKPNYKIQYDANFFDEPMYRYLQTQIEMPYTFDEYFSIVAEYKDRTKSVFNLWQGGKSKSNVLEYARDNDGYHPTQKPIALLEDLIQTYSNEGNTVLDFTMGSGSTGVACINTNRNFIGIELDKGYFDIAEKRINEAQNI
jgi:DNA modification methylase